MTVSKIFLENKVSEVNDWLQNNPTHRAYKEKKHERKYYIEKLCEMDNKGVDKINI